MYAYIGYTQYQLKYLFNVKCIKSRIPKAQQFVSPETVSLLIPVSGETDYIGFLVYYINNAFYLTVAFLLICYSDSVIEDF